MGEGVVLSTIQRVKLRDVVVERLKKYITAGCLKPGDRLPNETELAEQFGVSRLSLREATKALELFGIVESKTGVGLTVGTVCLERVTEHLGFHPALQNGSHLELLDTRVVVEIGALPYTAKRMAEDPTVYEKLCKNVEEFRQTRDLQKWIELDIAFHRALLDASGLAPLVAFNDLMQIFFQRFRDSLKKADWLPGIEAHQRIIDALHNQDVVLATNELRGHIEYHKGRMGVPA